MSKVTTNFLGNDAHDVDLIEKELRKFETIFPSAKVIRNHYKTESELEHDWKKFVLLPYSIKVLANDKCLRYFGKRNPQMYIEMKRKFLVQDIANKEIDNKYRPANLIEENSEFINRLARNYMKNNGAKLVTRDTEDYDSLKDQWNHFNSQSADRREMANTKSIEYYGVPVYDVYQNELHKYLMKDIDNADYESNTTIDGVSELAIENIREYLKDNTNLIESAILLDTARASVKTPVERTIYHEMENHFSKILNTKGVMYPILLDSTIGMTDDEVLKSLNSKKKLHMLEDNKFIAFQARLLGLDPGKSYAKRQDLLGESSFNKLKHGWNPVIKFNSRNCRNANRRMNKIIKEHCKFKIIPLYNIEMNLQEDFEPKRGVSILTIRDLEQNEKFNKLGTKVFLTFNPKDPYWYEFSNGTFMVKSKVQDALDQTKSGMVNVYFVELSDNLYNQAEEILKNFNKSDNKIKEVVSKLKSTIPNVANSNLFTINLLSSIFANKYGNSNDKTAVYAIYSGLNPSSYQDIEDAYQKLNIFTEYKNLTGSTFLEDVFKPNILSEMPIDNQTLLKDLDDFTAKESVDFNSEYQHIHNILEVCKESKDLDSMKYYAAKLLYMNTLLEDKLYYQENSPLIDLALIYQTRGNILQEANKCIAHIVSIDPKFDINDYSNMIFETTNKKPKKNFSFTEAYNEIKNKVDSIFSMLK